MKQEQHEEQPEELKEQQQYNRQEDDAEQGDLTTKPEVKTPNLPSEL